MPITALDFRDYPIEFSSNLSGDITFGFPCSTKQCFYQYSMVLHRSLVSTRCHPATPTRLLTRQVDIAWWDTHFLVTSEGLTCELVPVPILRISDCHATFPCCNDWTTEKWGKRLDDLAWLLLLLRAVFAFQSCSYPTTTVKNSSLRKKEAEGTRETDIAAVANRKLRCSTWYLGHIGGGCGGDDDDDDDDDDDSDDAMLINTCIVRPSK